MSTNLKFEYIFIIVMMIIVIIIIVLKNQEKKGCIRDTLMLYRIRILFIMKYQKRAGKSNQANNHSIITVAHSEELKAIVIQ